MDKDSNIKILDTYFSLCTEVYDLSKPNPPEDAYAFYRDYAMKASGPILELMCGTGRFLLTLLEQLHIPAASEQRFRSIILKSRKIFHDLWILIDSKPISLGS